MNRPITNEERDYYALNKRVYHWLAPFYEATVLPLRRLRYEVVRMSGASRDARVLDVATGTGDLAIELKRRGCEVVGSDFSEEMLVRARVKEPGIAWEWADAQALPYGDGEFAAATVGFGARNFGDLKQGLSEMARVVRPGGRVVVLEITTPTKPPLSTFFSLWFDRVVPLLGRFDDAYTYLPASVKRFPDARGVGAVMDDVGLRDVGWLITAGGIIAIHHGVVGD